MRVEFERHEKNGRVTCSWVALVGARTRVPGPVMAAGAHLPHDLAQYVAEAVIGSEHGFWGLIAAGATFKSTGRKATKPGRAVIREHRDELDAAETAANAVIGAWLAAGGGAGSTSPSAATSVALFATPRRQLRPESANAAFDAALAQWRALGPGDRLVFEWPSPQGTIVAEGYDALSRSSGV